MQSTNRRYKQLQMGSGPGGGQSGQELDRSHPSELTQTHLSPTNLCYLRVFLFILLSCTRALTGGVAQFHAFMLINSNVDQYL